MRTWADNSCDLVLDAKAYSLLTGQRTRLASLPARLRPLARGDWITADNAPPALLDAAWEHFHAGFEPLRRTGRLGRVLLQFPRSYVFGTRALRLVADALERCHPLRAAVEWRHPSWFAPENRERGLDLLREQDAAFVCVDMPHSLPDSVPALLEVTAATAVIRLHGHSPAWIGGGKEDRYRYEYTPEELTAWASRARLLAKQADDVHVVVNTCCAGAAQRAASRLQALLADP